MKKLRSYTGDTEPVKWVRIHNLPDFVYFNHSQHVSVAGLIVKRVMAQLKKWKLCINIHHLQWAGVLIVTENQT